MCSVRLAPSCSNRWRTCTGTPRLAPTTLRRPGCLSAAPVSENTAVCRSKESETRATAEDRLLRGGLALCESLLTRLVSIEIVTLHRVRLVLGWVSASSSSVRTVLVFNQPPRPTQPSRLSVERLILRIIFSTTEQDLERPSLCPCRLQLFHISPRRSFQRVFRCPLSLPSVFIIFRAGLIIVPVVPWEGATAARGPRSTSRFLPCRLNV